jgi:hypothetical protein
METSEHKKTEYLRSHAVANLKNGMYQSSRNFKPSSEERQETPKGERMQEGYDGSFLA